MIKSYKITLILGLITPISLFAVDWALPEWYTNHWCTDGEGHDTGMPNGDNEVDLMTKPQC